MPAWEYILTINGLLTIQKGSAETVCHGYEIIIGYFRSIQINYAIIEIDVRPLHSACLINPEATINHQNKDISCCLTGFLVVGVFD